MSKVLRLATASEAGCEDGGGATGLAPGERASEAGCGDGGGATGLAPGERASEAGVNLGLAGCRASARAKRAVMLVLVVLRACRRGVRERSGRESGASARAKRARRWCWCFGLVAGGARERSGCEQGGAAGLLPGERTREAGAKMVLVLRACRRGSARTRWCGWPAAGRARERSGREDIGGASGLAPGEPSSKAIV
jgi:hypothetical protein